MMFEKFAKEYGKLHYSNEYALLLDGHQTEVRRNCFNAGRLGGLREAAVIADIGADEGPVYCTDHKCIAAAIRAKMEDK